MLGITRTSIQWLAAELVVVVLGILIALSLDDYMSYRKDRAVAIDYVQRLHCSALADLNYFQDVWQPRLELKHRALGAILPVVRGDEPVPDDTHAFLRQVGLGGIWGTGAGTFIADDVFQDLVSTGNLRLMEDPFRGYINRYYSVTSAQVSSGRTSDRLRGLCSWNDAGRIARW